MIKLLRTVTYITIISMAISGCQKQTKASLTPGTWRGSLNIQGNMLPFNFEVSKGDSLSVYLLNSEERLELDEVLISGDSLYLPMHIFDAEIKASISDNRITGYWIKNYEEDYVIPFEAVYGDSVRFKVNTEPGADYDGKWRVTFIHHEDGDTTEAVGVFNQTGNLLTGTFLTPLGDYRYLEGAVDGKKLKLSTFDGGHAFLFVAELLNKDSIAGDFWSGKDWHETWTAVRDDNAKLPDADSLTYIKEGYDSFDFSFPGLDGDTISFSDYRGKPLIVSIFGTWCPNCMDETKFLKKWYDENHHRGIEILALAYEAKPDFEYARNRVLKMKKKLGVGYDFAIAGTKDKEEAAKTLPMLNHVLAFPTTIFIDNTGKVRRIHTGFTGPGTGHYYEQFVKEFNEIADLLLK